jgi:ADP-ribose pyrophosphatase
VPEFELERIEEIFEGHVFGVERRHLRLDGVGFEREVVTHPGAVAVLAVDDDDLVVLLVQFRATTGRRIIEMPAGTLDVEDEDPLSAARRELIEEAGVEAEQLSELGSFLNSPGYSTQLTTLYLAEGLREVGRAPMGIEETEMDVVRIPLAEALAMVEGGQISDAGTVLGLLLLARRRGA